MIYNRCGLDIWLSPQTFSPSIAPPHNCSKSLTSVKSENLLSLTLNTAPANLFKVSAQYFLLFHERTHHPAIFSQGN